MKTTRIVLAVLLALALLSGTAALAAEYDTMADWGLRIPIPEGTTGEYEGSDDCYYIYVLDEGSIPYLLITVYDYDSEEEFIPDFTEYMRESYSDLEVTSDAARKTIGGRICYEIDYGYKVSGYDVTDRRIVMTVDGRTYMFASKEVEELDLMIGDMLEDVVANCEFLSVDGQEEEGLADAYLYCQEDGMPKYWLDITGSLTDNLVLHCWFRSSDPTFYESWFILDLDTAEFDDDIIEICDVYDQYGFDHSDWFDSLTLQLLDDSIVMDVERNESTMAGGEEDNILTGTYEMVPAGAGLAFDYLQDDGMKKYWLDLSGDDIVLYGMFRSGDPEFYEDHYTFGMDDAEWDGDYTVHVRSVYDSEGRDVSSWFDSITLSEVQGGILMNVERDESTLAGGEEDNVLTGVYMFEPRTYLLPADEGPYTAGELGVLAQRYYFAENGFFPPEADVEDNGDGTYSVHLYENVDLDGLSHTATSAWYTVDEYGDGADDITGQEIYLAR